MGIMLYLHIPWGLRFVALGSAYFLCNLCSVHTYALISFALSIPCTILSFSLLIFSIYNAISFFLSIPLTFSFSRLSLCPYSLTSLKNSHLLLPEEAFAFLLSRFVPRLLGSYFLDDWRIMSLKGAWVSNLWDLINPSTRVEMLEVFLVPIQP